MGIFGIGDKPSEWSQVTQTKEKLDWTHFLTPDATGFLRSVLEAAYKHRVAYFKADDVKNAQLWSAIIELKREIAELNAKVDKMKPVQRDTFRLEQKASPHVMEKIRAAMQPTAEDSREAVDALVSSLMKF